MDFEVSHVNLQRGAANTAAVRLDVEGTQLTGGLVHKRQVMVGGERVGGAARRLVLGRRRRCVLCKLLLHPHTQPLSTLLQSRLHPSASHTALRPIRLYVLAPPREGLCQLCSHLQLSLGAANSKFYQTCRRTRFYKKTRRHGRPRLSGEFLEFRATRRDGPRAALPPPFLWRLEFELRKRRSTCAAFPPTYFPSTKKGE